MSAPDVQYLPTNDPDFKVISLNYNDLVNNVDLSKYIAEAYGYDGLGLLTIRGVPGFSKARQDLLPLAHKYANLPEEIKNKTVHEASHYSFGWSHGKEKMTEGKPDWSKGSYYNNPVHDEPIKDKELIAKYPSFCTPNIWPKEDLPEFEPAFKAMGKLVVETGTLLAQQCDRYIHSKLPSYPKDKLTKIMRDGKTHKARLLNYFPVTTPLEDGDFSSWCGWHNDHGSLTGLVPAMYIDSNGKEVPNPDPSSGLYIKSRSGKLIQGKLPTDHMAFQIGETACVHSGGLLQATPHCVRAAQGDKAIGVSRDTFAVFMEPEWWEKMDIPEGATVDNVTKGYVNLPPGVPVLAKRWKPEQDFGQFTDVTLQSYY